MKVLSGSITTKALTGVGMEPFIDSSIEDDVKMSALPKQLCNQEDRGTHSIESGSKWNIMKKLKRSRTLPGILPRSHADATTQLFGQPLCKTCPDEHSLPKPIAELLALLWKKGPSTEGVFRKPANIRAMRTTRDQLNSGQEVDMDSLSVFLLVGLLKNFLKELPGSLLCLDLYESWMKALAVEDTQQKTTEIKRVVEKLPVPNQLLLQHLLSVLHHILENADINKMDAHNLAVCIAPTLLQLDSSPLEEQKDHMNKVTELTQFLIERCCEIMGDNILSLFGDPDEVSSDSQSYHQHDSAYDSTDPEADGDAGDSAGSTHGEGSGSFPCLAHSRTAVASRSSDAIFNTFVKPAFNRRCSEPIIFPTADRCSLHSLARSHDDCSMERQDFEDQPLKKQISDESFLRKRQSGTRPTLSLPKLGGSLNMETVAGTMDTHVPLSKDCSCSSSCSLESAASNQSEGSVFTSSPLASPANPRRAHSTRQAPLSTKLKQDIPRADLEVKRRTQSLRADAKVALRTRSLGAFTFSRCSLKKGDIQKESAFPCETLQEDFQSEVEPQTELKPKPRPLSAIEVFHHVDSRLPSRPPSYEQAVQSGAQPAPPHYRSMTVQDARELGRKSRPTSVNGDFLSTCPVNRYSDCFSQVEDGSAVGVVELRVPFRNRAMSESGSRNRHEAVSRRCSQPLFEEYSYAKESYV